MGTSGSEPCVFCLTSSSAALCADSSESGPTASGVLWPRRRYVSTHLRNIEADVCCTVSMVGTQ